jgi:hypothetical protein
MAFPGLSLPCELCRAVSHDKDFAVPIGPFAVRPSRTAKKQFPVVSVLRYIGFENTEQPNRA